MDIKKTPKNATIFNCEKCAFTCRKQSDWDRHIARPKHLGIQKNIPLAQQNAKNTCVICSRYYKYYSGLWKHRKTCLPPQEPEPATSLTPSTNIVLGITEKTPSELTALTNLVLELVKSNTELQRQMMEVCRNSNNTIINANNNNNKTFNMQVFLNEQCKDAMDIKDFINSFQLELSDLENVGELGYVQGISDLIVKKLSALDVCKRPIHCSDIKRETMYIHENNVWIKDNATHDRLRLAIRYIAKKNSDLIIQWYNAHPGVEYSEHRLNDKYTQIVLQAMGGKSTQFTENEDKVMRRIAKTVLVDKAYL